mmetsp:Transcript_100107/g.182643  ORF Transcript_100107/g.182643 Transcript_100107/m.182643 type:complete len:493 (+) Transcript_100107:64-1542(+)
MGSNCCSGVEFQTPVPTYLFEGEDRKTSFAVPSENGRLKDFDGADSPIRAVQSKGRLKEFSFNATDVENMQMVANWQVEMQVKLKLEAPDLAETTALLQDVALDPSSKALCHKQTPLQPNLHCAVNGRAVSQQGEACHQEVDHEQLEKPGDGAGDAETTGELESKEANRGPWHKSLPPGAAAPEPVDKAALEMPQGFSMEASRLILPPSTKASIETKGAEQRVKSWGEVDILVSRRLDKFFSNDSLWQQVADEIARTKQLQNMEWLQATPPAVHAKFRVQVPEPYPGIQYRRSKELSDRYPKYAKHGTTVPGILEDNGEWLKVGENVYLPTKVGAIEILKPVPGDAPAVAAPNPTPPLIESVAKFDDFKGAAPTAVTSLPDPEADGCTEAGRVDPRTHTVMRMTALRSPSDSLQEPLNTRPLSNLDEASRWLSGVDPNNPFTDTPRGGSPSESPLRSRLPSDQMAPINPFSDTPPGGSPSVSPLRSRPPASM